MLSPGTYHEHVPKDPAKNVVYRLALLEKCRDPKFRLGVIAACREDILFFINSFVVQINPDTMDKGPFITWPYQDVAICGGDIDIGDETRWQAGLLACVSDRKDVRWPKSRDGGASWCVLITIVWLCLFHENIAAGAVSRDVDSVDKIGDPNSLFEKVRFMLARMPEWLKGGKIEDKKLSFRFPNGNTLNGEANVQSANVGGRLTILLIDEFGQFDKNGEWIYDFTRDVCKCRVFVFTHKDQFGMAYQLCYDAKYKEMREIMTHWAQHPRKRPGLYRYNDETNQIDVIDKIFDFNAICNHGVLKKKGCPECKSAGMVQEFEFVMEAKPVGGPCPGLRSPWYDQECKARSDRDVAMNLDIDPRGASDKPFDSYRIKLLIREPTCRPPVWQGDLKNGKLVEGEVGPLKLWIHPKPNDVMPIMRVGVAADVSAGSGATPSCLSMMNATTGEKFLEYSNALIFANEFAEFTVNLCRLFKDARGRHPLLVWEIQGGSAFGRRVRELNYVPVYIRADEDAIGRPRDNKGRPGINANDSNAVLALMNDYRDALYDGRCVNPSEFALDETLKFVYTNRGIEYRGSKKPRQAEEGSNATIHHGDIVKADMMAWKMCKELGGYLGRDEEDEPVDGWIDPRSLAGRMKLFDEQQEDELVWR